MTYRTDPKPSTLRLYGMTLEDWNALFEHQLGRCPMCAKNFCRTRQPVVDHDHKSWAVRGLVCGPCNRLIGFLHDNAIWLRAAADYLDWPPAAHVFTTPRRHASAPPLEIA